MKTFIDVTNKSGSIKEEKNQALPTFVEMKEGIGVSCISEEVQKKLDKICEAMCSEMKAIHEDTTKRTCETYSKEAEGKLNEMISEIKKQCESYLAALH